MEVSGQFSNNCDSNRYQATSVHKSGPKIVVFVAISAIIQFLIAKTWIEYILE